MKIKVKYNGRRFPRIVAIKSGNKTSFQEDRRVLELDEYDALYLLNSNARLSVGKWEFTVEPGVGKKAKEAVEEAVEPLNEKIQELESTIESYKQAEKEAEEAKKDAGPDGKKEGAEGEKDDTPKEDKKPEDNDKAKKAIAT